jgi:hypothetical protein
VGWVRQSLEANFTPTPGGFLFQIPRLFRPGERYIVTEHQKVGILGIMSSLWRVLLLGMLALLLAGLAAAAVTWAFGTSSLAEVLLLLIKAAAVVALGFVIVVDHRRKLRRISLILAGQPQTDA